MDPDEKKIEDGLAIQEMERGAGWQLLASSLRQSHEATLKELRQLDLEGRSLESVGSDYIRCIQRINAIDQVFEIVEEFKTRKEEAESK